MFHLILYQPEIPPNTGNIIRLAANTGAVLHLIEPLGFFLDDRRLLRAGLDYYEFRRVKTWKNWEQFRQANPASRLLALSTRGRRCYSRIRYRPGDGLLLGPETRGLPDALLTALPEEQRLYIPMQPGSRSLNLANSAAIVLYEALRQHDFAFPGE